MKIINMRKGSWGKLTAFFDVATDEGFIIKGFKLVNGINGPFVGFPSQKGNDDEYYDTVWYSAVYIRTFELLFSITLYVCFLVVVNLSRN